MRHFFFDVDAGEMRADYEGAQLPDLDAARAFASGILSTIGTSDDIEAETRVIVRVDDGSTFEVTAEIDERYLSDV